MKKYIKYKQKYFNLKIGGGNDKRFFTDIQDQLTKIKQVFEKLIAYHEVCKADLNPTSIYRWDTVCFKSYNLIKIIIALRNESSLEWPFAFEKFDLYDYLKYLDMYIDFLGRMPTVKPVNGQWILRKVEPATTNLFGESTNRSQVDIGQIMLILSSIKDMHKKYVLPNNSYIDEGSEQYTKLLKKITAPPPPADQPAADQLAVHQSTDPQQATESHPSFNRSFSTSSEFQWGFN